MYKITLNPLIRALTDEEVTKVCLKVVPPVIKVRVKESYNLSKNAYNRKFAPLKKPTGLPPVIGLRDYYRYTRKVDAISITSSKYYSIYHHTGTKHMPARSPFPRQDKLPKSWERPIVEAINANLKRLFSK